MEVTDEDYPPVNPPPSDAYLDRWNARHGIPKQQHKDLPDDLAEFLRDLG